MSRAVRPMGDRALLVECRGLEEVMALHTALERDRPDGVVDVVPAARTVLVTVADGSALPDARRWVEAARPDGAGAVPSTGRVDIRVDYGGEDLAEVARLLGVPERDVVDRHTSSAWRVAFGGFAPGFAYLVEDDPALRGRLDVPRMAVPRTSVPAGSVALAGGFTGVYPRASPGGWRLIGTTDAVLWDASASEPALLRPGAVVRFREAT